MTPAILRVGQLLVALQVIKTIELHAAVVFSIKQLISDQPMMLADWTVLAAGLLIYLLPVVALIGLVRNRAWGFLPIVVYPLIATFFGVIPVPFLHHLYLDDVEFMNSVIIIVNLLFAAVALLLYVGVRTRAAASMSTILSAHEDH